MRLAMPILTSLAFTSISLPAMAGPIATATGYVEYSIQNSTIDPSLIDATFSYNVIKNSSLHGTGTATVTDTLGPNRFEISTTAAVGDQGVAHSYANLDYSVSLTNKSSEAITFDLWWDFSSSIGSAATIDLGKFETAGFNSTIQGTLVGDNHFCRVSDSGFEADLTGTTEDHLGQRTCYIQSADSSMNFAHITLAAAQTINAGYGLIQVTADAAVPEPATMLLFGFGVLSLAGLRYRL